MPSLPSTVSLDSWVTNLVCVFVGVLLVYCYNRLIEGARFRREQNHQKEERQREVELAGQRRTLEWCDALERDLRSAILLSEKLIQSERGPDDIRKVTEGWPDLDARLTQIPSADRAFLGQDFNHRMYHLFGLAATQLSELQSLQPVQNPPVYDQISERIGKRSRRMLRILGRFRQRMTLWYKDRI